MRYKGKLISVLLVSFLLVCSSVYSKTICMKKKMVVDIDKPFAGKFKGTVVLDNVAYKVTYILEMDDEGNITGEAKTFLSGELVLNPTVSGSVNEGGKTADITLTGTFGLTPSDDVRITLKNNAKTGVKMQYLVGGEPWGEKVNYRRLKECVKIKQKFDSDKPFAGKFKGTVVLNDVAYKVTYILEMDDEGNITGEAKTFLSGELVLNPTVSGSVNEGGKTADITLTGTFGLTPSDDVRITLKNNAKTGVKMQYLVGGEPWGEKVNYRRLKWITVL